MNAALLIEKKIGEVADRSTKALAAEIHVKELLRTHLLARCEAYGVDVGRAQAVSQIHEMADSILGGIKSYIERVAPGSFGDLMLKSSQDVLNLAVNYVEKKIDPKLRLLQTKRQAMAIASMGQNTPEIFALAAKDQAVERARIMQALEQELAEIEAGY